MPERPWGRRVGCRQPPVSWRVQGRAEKRCRGKASCRENEAQGLWQWGCPARAQAGGRCWGAAPWCPHLTSPAVPAPLAEPWLGSEGIYGHRAGWLEWVNRKQTSRVFHFMSFIWFHTFRRPSLSCHFPGVYQNRPDDLSGTEDSFILRLCSSPGLLAFSLLMGENESEKDTLISFP